MSQEIHMPHETASVKVIVDAWNEIAGNPNQLTDMGEQMVLFAAGGGLPLEFGNEKSEIWQAIYNVADADGNVTIAGITRSLDELRQLGRFYRFLGERGFKFHCIDERLMGDLDHVSHQVHEHCGACQATTEATGRPGTEDRLLVELGETGKQGIYEDMTHHKSLVFSVDLDGARVAEGEVREQLKNKGALAFNASIPLDLVEEWHEIYPEEDVTDLLETLVLWNPQIARNIIGGSHNEYASQADETIMVVNKQGVGDNPWLPMVQRMLARVPHKTTIEIK